MRSIRWSSGEVAAPRRYVWLPGAYHHAADFIEAGFARAVQERQLACDLEFIDLDMQHLQDRAVLQHLREQVLLPARDAGEVWLCGISLGGLIALTHARRYGAEIDGLLLLAPYLGSHLIVRDIERAPGLDHWQPGQLSADDDERQAWRYVKQRDPSAPRIYLGYGTEDRFANAQRLLAAVLPSSSVDTITGGHDWPTWERLWGNFLNLQCR